MPHYFDEEQKGELKIRKFSAIVRWRNFDFFSSGGVFSKDEVDTGTRILAENMVVKDGNLVLDLGCGIGVIGIVMGKLFPDSAIIMTDINKRAVKLAEMNLRLNSVVNAEVRQGNLYDTVKERFDVIVVNPPMKAGYKVCFEIVDRARDFLKDGGSLQLVALHNKGGSRLAERMKDVFGNVETVVKKSGFRVYISKKE